MKRAMLQRSRQEVRNALESLIENEGRGVSIQKVSYGTTKIRRVALAEGLLTFAIGQGLYSTK